MSEPQHSVDASELRRRRLAALSRHPTINEPLADTTVSVQSTAQVPRPASPLESEASQGFECRICLDMPVEPVVSRCGHLFCWPCIWQWLEAPRSNSNLCPVCKSVIQPYRDKLIPLYGAGAGGRKHGEPPTSASSSAVTPTTVDNIVGGATRSDSGTREQREPQALQNEPQVDVSQETASAAERSSEAPERPRGQQEQAQSFNHFHPFPGFHGPPFHAPQHAPGGGGVHWQFAGGFGVFPGLLGVHFNQAGFGFGGFNNGGGAQDNMTDDERRNASVVRMLWVAGMIVLFALLWF